MIRIAGTIHRSFNIPSGQATALAFFQDLSRLAGYLPHIDLERSFGQERFRMVYSATEMSAYHIRIFCDVQSQLLPHEGLFRIRPVQDFPPVKARATFNSASGQGYYASETAFTEENGETRVEFSLELGASLPRPKGLRFMPASMVSSLAQEITERRIKEIAEGFMQNAQAAFPAWAAARNGHRAL